MGGRVATANRRGEQTAVIPDRDLAAEAETWRGEMAGASRLLGPLGSACRLRIAIPGAGFRPPTGATERSDTVERGRRRRLAWVPQGGEPPALFGIAFARTGLGRPMVDPSPS